MQNKNGFQANFTGQLHFGVPGKDGGYYLVNAIQINANTLRLTFTPSQDGMPPVDPVDIDIPGATDEQIRKIVEEYLGNASDKAVLYTEQTPTPEEQAQARKNIGVSSNFYRATDYGISTDSEDNTPALQELVDAVSEAGGGTIFFPVGTYKFKHSNLKDKYEFHVFSVLMKSNVSIVGENIETTVLKQTVAIPYSLFYFMGEAETPITGCSFSNFTVDAYDTGNRNAVYGKAFFFQYVRDCVFRDLRLMGTVATAMGIDFLDRVVIDNVSCIDCGRTYTGTEAGTSGIGIGTCGWENENFIVTNCVCSGCGQYGIFIENQGLFGDGNVNYAKGCIISNCIVRNGLNKGIGVRGGQNVTVIGCETYENTSHGIYIDNNCKDLKVISCSSAGNGACGICIEPNAQSNRVVVRDCHFVDNEMQGIAVNTSSMSLCLVNNYTAGNSIGLEVLPVVLIDCAIKGNILFDGHNINAVFSGDAKYNDFAEVIPDLVTTTITSDMYTEGYKLNPDGSIAVQTGASAILSYIDVSALGSTFTFTFANPSGMSVRIAQYDSNKVSLDDNFGMKWYTSNPASVTINKMDGCKYIRICASSGIAVGELENTTEPDEPIPDIASTNITADMYTNGKKLMPDGSVTDEVGAYTIVAYIDVSGFSDNIVFDFSDSVCQVDKGHSFRVAQYDANHTCLTVNANMFSIAQMKKVPIAKQEGCKYIRVYTNTCPTVGELRDSLASDRFNITVDDYTEGYKLTPDGLGQTAADAYTTMDYIDVSDIDNVFYLYFGDSEASNVGNAVRVAQYGANYAALSDSSPFPSISGKTSLEINKLEGCQYIRIFSSMRPTVCQIVDALPE